MTTDQATIFVILGLALALFVWDRVRYDVVALLALLATVMTGLVDGDQAFSGFSDSAVVTVAAVLVISTALRNAGFVEWVMGRLGPILDRPALQVVALTGIVAALSAFMNNVGALAVALPVGMQLAKRSGRPVGDLLMPAAFGSLLGGLITLIGTPPNLLISAVRKDITGQGFAMFDFAPVGLAMTALGLVYLSVGWRLIPRGRSGASDEPFAIDDSVAEVMVPEGAPLVGKRVSELEAATHGEGAVTAIIREHFRRYVPAGHWTIFAGDVLVIECDPQVLKALVDQFRLQVVGSKELPETAPDDMTIVEAVVSPGSRLVGCSPVDLQLRDRYRVNLLAVGRRARRTGVRLKRVKFAVGDVAVLQGSSAMMPETLSRLGLLPLARRDLHIGRPRKAILTAIFFLAAILATTFDVVPAAIAFTAAVVALVLVNAVTLTEAYGAIAWPVIVLLGAMIPVSEALRTTGATDLVAGWLVAVGGHLPPMLSLGLILAVTMAITPILNNAATVLVMAPIAAGFAARMGLSLDPFFMAVAVGASCDFLTPIGHQSNTLVMGPGGYRFSDYWRVGLPLTIMILLAGPPMILAVWPV
ncbi:MAG TPA: SLC13 family permease [Candidatus Omnitrophota bacterium]|nr:SLC13 family permease [Candidatus Omnitrophota bacterium]